MYQTLFSYCHIHLFNILLTGVGVEVCEGSKEGACSKIIKKKKKKNTSDVNSP